MANNYGLVDSTAIEAIFRTLSHEITLEIEHADDFEFVLEKLCIIINNTVSQLNIQLDEDIDVPQIFELTDGDNASDLAAYDLKWKYYTSIVFIKSLLRKYSLKYKSLSDKILGNLDTAVPHQSTKEQIKIWLGELNSI